MPHPSLLTPERIDAMLSIVAEVCLESVVEAGARQKIAEDAEDFERCGRALQTACRNLRQTIAMKQRHDREQERRADDGRRRVEAERLDAERHHRRAVETRRSAVNARISRLIWDEYEQDDALDLSEHAEERLKFLVDDPDFLDAPLETLVQRVADEIGLNDVAEPAAAEPSPPCGARVGRGGVISAVIGPAPSPPTPPSKGEGKMSEPSAPSAIPTVEPDGSAAAAEAAEPPPTDPPPRPPDPPPEPYIPPWERLRPGQVMLGGGW